MVSESEQIDELVKACQRSYDIGFIDGKDVGIEEGMEEKSREFVPKRWEV